MIGWFLKFIHGNDKKVKNTQTISTPVEYETIEESIEVIDDLDDDTEHVETISESVKAVFDELNEMTDEEFDAELRKHMSFEEGQCHPEECEGECDGMGWCEIATDYRNKTDHRKGR